MVVFAQCPRSMHGQRADLLWSTRGRSSRYRKGHMNVQPEISMASTRQWINVEEHVHHIILGGAGPINTFSPTTYAEIHDGLLHAYNDERVDCVVIQSEGDTFAVGGDLKTLVTLLDGGGPGAVVRADEAFSSLPFRVALRSSKPLVCLVDGLCIGGGLILALASDIVIATSKATFAVSEARVGVFDPYVAELLPRVVGLTRARHMAVTASTVDAVTAERWGIVTVLVDDVGAATASLNMVISEIRRTSPTARGLYKRTMTNDVRATDNFEVMRIATGKNGQEGLHAFLDRRPAAWKPLASDEFD